MRERQVIFIDFTVILLDAVAQRWSNDSFVGPPGDDSLFAIVLTEKEIEYRFKLLLEDRSISVLAYNLETIMAEKLETVISRGDQNTRPRDYYDIYILTKLQYSNINIERLKKALSATTEKRGSSIVVKDYRRIMNTVENSDIMQRQWNNYQKDFDYATDILFKDVCEAVVKLMGDLTDI